MRSKVTTLGHIALLLLLFFCQTPVFSQVALPVIADAEVFPLNWVGIWRGELDIYTPKGKQQSVPMQLHILPTEDKDRFTWSVIYGDPEVAGAKRPYDLLVKDRAAGHYAVDEHNSIVLDAYLIEGKLFSRFEVMGSLLLATNEVVEGKMIYEIISGGLDPVAVTGGTQVEGEDMPPVSSYHVVVRQRAVLVRE